MFFAGQHRVPLLAVSVNGIIFCGAKKQMGGVTARRVVTFVKCVQPVWYRAVVQFPRKTLKPPM